MNYLAEDWASLRGAFNTRYDWEYSRFLAEQIRHRGGDHPPLGALALILTVVVSRWAEVIPRFQQEISAYDERLGVAARDRTLLHIPPDVSLSRRTAQLIHECAGDLALGWDDVVADWPPALRQEVEQWRQMITVDRAELGQNTSYRRFFRSPLSSAPLVDSTDGVLLALPHVLSTDLSRLIERMFAQQPGLQYYRARGDALEKVALRDLSRVFTGGRALHGGKYPGERPGELIEVDGVILWEDIALVVESKGGYLSLRARHGDPQAAVADLRKTIGDGFFQAARLLRKLEHDRRVKLVNADGEALELDAAKIRRIYTIIPTADTFGSITIDLDLFTREQILPDTAIPLIIAAQDLGLLVDLTPTPLEFLAYLAYREEILAHPTIHIADELEILGNFVAGHDIVSNIAMARSRYTTQLSQPEWKHRSTHLAAISPDAQQTYLNPWITASGAAWQHGNSAACPPPPRRHHDTDRARIERFFADTHHSAAATCLFLFDISELHLVRTAAQPKPRRGAPALYHQGDHGVVVLARTDTVKTARRHPAVQQFRSHMRLVAYLREDADGVGLCHAEWGKKHIFAGDPNATLADRSRFGNLATWFDEFARRRRRADRDLAPIDLENRAALVRAGMQESLAVGIVRLGLTDHVLDLMNEEIGLNQAADMYLTHVRRAANRLGVAASDIALTRDQIRAVHRLITGGAVKGDDITTLLCLAIDNPHSTPRTLADDAGLTTAASDTHLHAVVAQALESIGLSADDLRLLNAKNRRKVRDRVLGTIRANLPSANMHSAATLIETMMFTTDELA